MAQQKLPGYRTDNFSLKSELLLRIAGAFFTRGFAKTVPKNPKTFVVIQTAQIGDMICTTPVFRAIKKKYPASRLIVYGRGINTDVIAGNPDVDRFVSWNEDVRTLVEGLKAERADFGLVTSPNFLGIALMYLAGVKAIAAPIVRGGWSPYETKPYRLVRRLMILKDHIIGKYVPGEYLRLLEPIGIQTTDTKKYCFATPEAHARARSLFARTRAENRFVIGILSGAGNKIKQWHPERFAEVADHIIKKYNATIVIVGAQNERQESDAIIAAVQNKDHVIDTTGTLSIDEAKALVGALDMLVGVDTGPMFFAEAQDVPTVDIACNIDENEQAPNDGKTHLVVVPPVRNKAAPVLTMNPKLIDLDEARRQVDSVTAPMVIEKVDELIAKLKPKS